MAGGEIAERLAEVAGAETLISHIHATFPDKTPEEIRSIQRRFYNAFKHAVRKDGRDRKDQHILESFDPETNHHVLYHGWYDFMRSGLPIPIEVQVFEPWYFARYSEKVNPEVDMSLIYDLFPNLSSWSAERQHRALTEAIRKAKKNGAVMNDASTDRRPLVLTWVARS